MSPDVVPSDRALLDLLRQQGALGITELAAGMAVTPTAVRQRLSRLMRQGYVERLAAKGGRGRPSHRYSLTGAGRRKAGSNFADLAIALWREIRAVRNDDVRRGLLERVARHMSDMYAPQVQGENRAERMEAIAALFAERTVPFTVDRSGGLPVLTAHACPYPELAEEDRTICAVERMMFSDLMGEKMRLTRCRLDGDSCCTFEGSTSVEDTNFEEIGLEQAIDETISQAVERVER